MKKLKGIKILAAIMLGIFFLTALPGQTESMAGQSEYTTGTYSGTVKTTAVGFIYDADNGVLNLTGGGVGDDTGIYDDGMRHFDGTKTNGEIEHITDCDYQKKIPGTDINLVICDDLLTITGGKGENLRNILSYLSGYEDAASKIRRIKITGNVTAEDEAERMFAGFTDVKEIQGQDKIKCTADAYSLFGYMRNCRNLESVDLSGFDLPKACDWTAAFNNMLSLREINIGDNKLPNAFKKQDPFNGKVSSAFKKLVKEYGSLYNVLMKYKKVVHVDTTGTDYVFTGTKADGTSETLKVESDGKYIEEEVPEENPEEEQEKEPEENPEEKQEKDPEENPEEEQEKDPEENPEEEQEKEPEKNPEEKQEKDPEVKSEDDKEKESEEKIEKSSDEKTEDDKKPEDETGGNSGSGNSSGSSQNSTSGSSVGSRSSQTSGSNSSGSGTPQVTVIVNSENTDGKNDETSGRKDTDEQKNDTSGSKTSDDKKTEDTKSENDIEENKTDSEKPEYDPIEVIEETAEESEDSEEDDNEADDDKKSVVAAGTDTSNGSASSDKKATAAVTVTDASSSSEAAAVSTYTASSVSGTSHYVWPKTYDDSSRWPMAGGLAFIMAGAAVLFIRKRRCA